MAYEKQTWEDRQVEKPLTFQMQNNSDGTVTLIPYPGNIISEGSKMNAERFNHIEDGIANLNPVVGTWTPTITTIEGAAPTIEYNYNVGNFLRINDLCYIDFYISGKITALTGTDNYGVVKGLPYKVIKSTFFGQNSLTTGVCYNLVANTGEIQLNPFSTDYGIRIQTNRGALACNLQVTPSGQYFQIGGNGWYKVDLES